MYGSQGEQQNAFRRVFMKCCMMILRLWRWLVGGGVRWVQRNWMGDGGLNILRKI